VDQTYHNAVKRKKQLEAELLEVETFLSLYPKFSSGESQSAPPADSKRVDATPGGQPRLATSPGHFNQRRGNPDQIASMVEAILMSHSRPMTRGELADEMERMGVRLPAKDKAKYIGTILWRKRRLFQNLEGKGYWLKGLPLEKRSANFWLKHSAALADPADSNKK
jgi:hypothetical protein